MDPARLDEPIPDSDLRFDDGLLAPPRIAWQPHAKFQDRRWRHALLFLLTFASTTFVGALGYAAFRADFQADRMTFDSSFFFGGLWYSVTILAILGCHELGHYLACRYYDVDASLPYFIPMPLLPTGTMGAFIRIREPIPSKRMLFDIGIAGPLAGFIVAVPALFIGLFLSRVAVVPPDFKGDLLGEPLLFKFAAHLIFGQISDPYSINLHPTGFAAWFGLLATALNLFPIGQLDGGHISYAVLGRKSSHVTLAMIPVAFVLSYVSRSWVVWTGLMIAMLVFFGRHHPRTFDEAERLDRGRVTLAFIALLIFAVCFTPDPWELIR